MRRRLSWWVSLTLSALLAANIVAAAVTRTRGAWLNVAFIAIAFAALLWRSARTGA